MILIIYSTEAATPCERRVENARRHWRAYTPIVLRIAPAAEIDKSPDHVLPTMAHPGAAHTEAREPGAGKYSCYVHGAIFDWIFLGEEALHRVQFRVPCGCVPNLLQWHWELSVLGESV
ncbi:hypothetical protein EVAR_7313_1 [Eumeta japonica]|uniref:Uncharacterized protein n=1 Tax=Eumeta variegata TaxID=151549 RepID=A0A4C1T5L9_EUMVA|nr:hypothetical protein EVAR_7313_1 [Eumeta japonica]